MFCILAINNRESLSFFFSQITLTGSEACVNNNTSSFAEKWQDENASVIKVPTKNTDADFCDYILFCDVS